MRKLCLSFTAAIALAVAGNLSADAANYNMDIATPVAAQLGGYLIQLNSYDQAFQNMDMYMMSPQKIRKSKKNKKGSSVERTIYECDTTDINDNGTMWVRPFASIENVDLRHGPNPKNHMYGLYMGGESQMKDLGRGWEGMWGAYAGYNGSHQAVTGNRIFENGGTFGFNGMLYKNNYFLGATASVGASAGNAHRRFKYTDDAFALLMTGAAIKTGYNWELAKGRFIIQPSFQTSYSFVNTFDKYSGSGARMDSSPLNAVQIEPGIKFVGNLKNGWQPYAGVSFVYNIIDKTSFRADGVKLPGFSVDPYVRYGFGIRKVWGERFTGFIQLYFMNGGRSGLASTGGFRFAVGKDGKNNINKDAKDPEIKSAEISLNYNKQNLKKRTK